MPKPINEQLIEDSYFRYMWSAGLTTGQIMSSIKKKHNVETDILLIEVVTALAVLDNQMKQFFLDSMYNEGSK